MTGLTFPRKVDRERSLSWLRREVSSMPRNARIRRTARRVKRKPRAAAAKAAREAKNECEAERLKRVLSKSASRRLEPV